MESSPPGGAAAYPLYGAVKQTSMPKRTKKISLAHMGSFEDTVRALVQDEPTHEDSQAEESGSTTEDAPESAPSRRRISRGQTSSGD